MHSTSASLLQLLGQQSERERAWERFVQLYTPLLYRWAKRVVAQESEAADLVQDVFVILLQKLPSFTYRPGGSFRGWLRTILENKAVDRLRRKCPSTESFEEQDLPQVPTPDVVDLLAEQEYSQYLTQRALQLIQTEFQETTWKAFWEFQVHGRPAAEVAAELGITANAVYLARIRVLTRLRQEVDGFLS